MLTRRTQWLPLAILLVGCGSDETIYSQAVQGFHFQGRDCLACHNSDLSQESRLMLGGTLFKRSGTTADPLKEACGGSFTLELLSSDTVTLIHRIKPSDPDTTKGVRGKGNFFALKRDYPPIQGDYIVRITTSQGTPLAQSATLHTFSADPYNVQTATDGANRYSCNACHTSGGVTAPLFVQTNVNLCR